MNKAFLVRGSTRINAPIERCFQLSTSIELVQRILGMRPVAKESKKISGLIAAEDQLVWRGWKFGLPQMHETLITAFDAPRYFQDTMGRGRFARFQHDHRFEEIVEQVGSKATMLEDEVRFAMPLGWAGALVARWIMVPHIRRLVKQRFALLKRVAESEEWREYLPDQVRTEPNEERRTGKLHPTAER